MARHVEREPKLARTPAKRGPSQYQMRRTGNWEELGQSLDYSEQRGLERGQFWTIAGGYDAGALLPGPFGRDRGDRGDRADRAVLSARWVDTCRSGRDDEAGTLACRLRRAALRFVIAMATDDAMKIVE